MEEKDLLKLAKKVKKAFSEVVPLDFNPESVKFLEYFIFNQREKLDEEGTENLVNSIGAFLGECIKKNYGGKWESDEENGWYIAFSEKSGVNPFVLVYETIESGEEKSFFEFYKKIPEMFKI